MKSFEKQFIDIVLHGKVWSKKKNSVFYLIIGIGAKKKGSGYIYVTVTFFKSCISSLFNIFRVAKNFIIFIINP